MKRMFSFFFAIIMMSSAVNAQSAKPATKANVPAAKPAKAAEKAAEKMVEKTTEKPAEKAKPSPAASATGKSGDAAITLNYSQPAVKGRKVWGDLVPFDKVWRTGANEATTIEFSKDVKIEGKALKAGKYALFSIPTEGGDWTIIFNKTAKQWGAYDYKEADDALRVKVKAGKAAAFAERLTFDVKDKNVMFAWENLSVGFKVE
jgi:hypothetical protein